MTVTALAEPITYNGDDSTVDFYYTWKIWAETEVKVQIENAAGTRITKTVNVDYIVSGVSNDSGGYVRFTTAPTSTEKVILSSNLPYTQLADYRSNSGYRPATLEYSVDRATRQIQQLKEENDRAITVPEGEDGISIPSETARADKIIYFDSSGDLTTVDPDTVIDHGSIGGLSDDDHTQYSRVDGTRDFTGTVGGVTPTDADHLTTKSYVDSEDDTINDRLTYHMQEAGAHGETMYEAFREPTGFLNNTDSVIAFDDSTRTLTISAVGSTFTYYISGAKIDITEPKTCQIADTEGTHLIYFARDGELHSVHEDDFTTPYFWTYAFVAYIYWDATNNQHIYFGDERHGCIMDGATHAYLHYTRGLQWISGLSMTGLTVDGDGSLNAHAVFGYVAGRVTDEDLDHDITGQPASASIPVFYKVGGTNVWRKQDPTDFPIIMSPSGSRPAYNEWNGSEWVQTEVANNDYFCIHIYATNDVDTPVIAIQGENEYATKADAETGATTELSNIQTNGLPEEEYTALATLLYQTKDTFTNDVKAILVTNEDGDDYTDWRSNEVAAGGAGGVTDHGALTGLTDDDHTIYSLADGSRAFTGEVDGVTPTTSAGLATKGYVDNRKYIHTANQFVPSGVWRVEHNFNSQFCAVDVIRKTGSVYERIGVVYSAPRVFYDDANTLRITFDGWNPPPSGVAIVY